MNYNHIDKTKYEHFHQLLKEPFEDLIIQLCQIGYGEGSLNCIIRDDQVAFTEVSRKKNTMFQVKKKT